MIVSASLGVYLRPIAERSSASTPCCAPSSRSATTACSPARWPGATCAALEKARRLDAWLGDAPAYVWAYGDSSGDRELLGAAPTARCRSTSAARDVLASVRGDSHRRVTQNRCIAREALRYPGREMSDFLAALARARPRLRRRLRHLGAGPGPRPRRLRRPRARGLQRAPRAHPARPHPPDARRVLRGRASTRSRRPPSARSAIVLAEYGIAEETFELNEQAARLAKEVAADFSDARPPALRDRLGRPGHEAPVARPHRLRRRCATPTSPRSRGCSTAASTSSSSRRSRTCSRARPRSSRARRAMASGRHRGAAHGAGHDRDHRAACSSARRSAPRSPRSRRCGPTSSASTAPPVPPR